MNLFRGQAVLSNVFPYPMNLNEERKEMLHMILQPTEKFLAEVNDPVKFVTYFILKADFSGAKWAILRSGIHLIVIVLS